MKQGVLLPHRVRLLMGQGHTCYHQRRKGERKRKVDKEYMRDAVQSGA